MSISAESTERRAAFADFAYRYSELGWPLVRVNGKKPKNAGWQKATAADPSFAAGEWARWGDRFNLGVVLGGAGLVVLEYDREDARESFDELLGGKLPRTPVSRTGSGRLHVYFVDPGDVQKGARDGLELRAGSHQCLVPPSIHPETGKPYEWLEGRAPWEVALAPLPPEVRAYFAETHSNGNGAAPVSDAIPEGERNRTLASLAGSMRRPGMSESEILAALLVVNEARCSPPLPHRDVEQIAHSIARYEPQRVNEAAARADAELAAAFTEAKETVSGVEPFPALDLDVFLATPPPEPDWDWRGFYARGDLVLEAGDPGVGKSFNAQARAVLAAVGGGEHLGEDVAVRRVVYFDLESPDDVVYSRQWALGLRGQVDGFAYVHRPPGFDLLAAGGLARFRETLLQQRAEVCFIDSLRRAAPGLDENDSRQVSLLLTALREIAAELKVTIVVIHHPRKPVGDAKVEALYAARGSGDLIGSVDSYIFYRKLAGGLIRLEHGKARRGREHEHVHFRIVENALGAPEIEQVVVASESEESDETLDAAVLEWLVSEGEMRSTSAVRAAISARASRVDSALERLKERDEVRDLGRNGGTWSGRGGAPRYWEPCVHGENTPSQLFGTRSDEVGAGSSHVPTSSPPSHPRRGDEVCADVVSHG